MRDKQDILKEWGNRGERAMEHIRHNTKRGFFGGMKGTKKQKTGGGGIKTQCIGIFP